MDEDPRTAPLRIVSGGRGAHPFKGRRRPQPELHPVHLLEALLRAGLRAALRPFFPPAEFTAEAGYVIDGDTFYLKGRKGRIRIWGVDAPEMGMDGAEMSKLVLAALVRGKRIRCVKMDVDRYDRTVARCFFEDGRDLGELMIESGTAREYLYYTWGHYTLRRLFKTKAQPIMHKTRSRRTEDAPFRLFDSKPRRED